MTVEEILERLKGLQRYDLVASKQDYLGVNAHPNDCGKWVLAHVIEKIIREIEATQ